MIRPIEGFGGPLGVARPLDLRTSVRRLEPAPPRLAPHRPACDGGVALLQRMVRDAFGCDSSFVAVVPVIARVAGGPRLFAVTVFRLIGHPTAKHGYAWPSSVEATQRREFILVLEGGEVMSPESAVESVNKRRG